MVVHSSVTLTGSPKAVILMHEILADIVGSLLEYTQETAATGAPPEQFYGG